MLFVFETHDAEDAFLLAAGAHRLPICTSNLELINGPWRVTRGVALAAAQCPGPAAAAPPGRGLQECTFTFQAFPVGELWPKVIFRVPTLSDSPGPEAWHFVAEPAPGLADPAHRSPSVRQLPPER